MSSTSTNASAASSAAASSAAASGSHSGRAASKFDVVTEVIHARRTGHKWLPEPVDAATVDAALLAAHMAPCHKLTWPWRFSVVGGKTREEIVKIGLAVKCGDDASEEKRAQVRAKLQNAGALIVVRQVKTPGDAHREKEDYAAVACAMQNAMLVATAAGYASKWSSGKLTQHPKVAELAKVDVEKEDVVGFLWIGVPEKLPSIERPPLASVVERLP